MICFLWIDRQVSVSVNLVSMVTVVRKDVPTVTMALVAFWHVIVKQTWTVITWPVNAYKTVQLVAWEENAIYVSVLDYVLTTSFMWEMFTCYL